MHFNVRKNATGRTILIRNVKKYLLTSTWSFFVALLPTMNQAAVNRHQNTHHLYKVFSNPAMRYEFSKFLDYVLRQVPSTQFFALVDQMIQPSCPQSDKQLYENLLMRSNEIKPSLPFYHQLKTLKRQKNILSKQAKLILGSKKEIDGYVEIGTPGTYLTSMKSFLHTTGNVYIINDKTRWTDRFQSFTLTIGNAFLPYNHFVPLNEYDEIKEKDIPSESIDLIVCFMGLHHVPENKLDSFVASIARILRPNGIFLLRDYDCQNNELRSIIYAAHSVYNVLVTGESVQAEAQDYRNFRELHYWIDLLKRHGFEAGSTRLLQAEDPTYNTMLAFTKLPQSEEATTASVAYALKKTGGYQRDIAQTYLSAPERLSVDVSQEYAQFIEHAPFYEFPYLNSVQSYWHVFGKSWQAASKRIGNLRVLTSPYTFMNVFIGVAMSVEYAAKSLVSWPIRLLYAGQESDTLKMLIKDPHHEIERLNNHCVVLKHYENDVKLIRVPRYKEFLKTMNLLKTSNIDIVEIAGQKEIQCKVRYKNNLCINWTLDGCAQEYEWHIPTQPTYTYIALTVEVDKLTSVIKQLEQQGIEILYIHDY